MQNRFTDYITHVGSAIAIFYFIFTWQFRGTGASGFSPVGFRASVLSLAGTLVFWGLVKLSRELFNRRHSLVPFGTGAETLSLKQLNEGSDIAIKVR
jgi:hypothetical protein